MTTPDQKCARFVRSKLTNCKKKKEKEKKLWPFAAAKII
jgi:hypothetical protein